MQFPHKQLGRVNSGAGQPDRTSPANPYRAKWIAAAQKNLRRKCRSEGAAERSDVLPNRAAATFDCHAKRQAVAENQAIKPRTTLLP
jgi:hypothetical protein